MPPTAPMIRADIGPTKPEAGGITTRPATAPEMPPRTVGLPVLIHSMSSQPSAAAAAAKWVATKALLAPPPALRALPALKPNQPTHRRAAPITLRTTLWGAMATLPKPRRFPITRAQIRAE